LNKNVGLEVGYSELNTSGKSPITIYGQEAENVDVELKMSGLEVALTGTF